MIFHSASVNFPGFSRMAFETLSFPMSCSRAARRTSVTMPGAQRHAFCDLDRCLGHTDGMMKRVRRLGVDDLGEGFAQAVDPLGRSRDRSSRFHLQNKLASVRSPDLLPQALVVVQETDHARNFRIEPGAAAFRYYFDRRRRPGAKTRTPPASGSHS